MYKYTCYLFKLFAKKNQKKKKTYDNMQCR